MTHCPRHRIHSLGPCPACIAEWNQGVDRAVTDNRRRPARERAQKVWTDKQH